MMSQRTDGHEGVEQMLRETRKEGDDDVDDDEDEKKWIQRVCSYSVKSSNDEQDKHSHMPIIRNLKTGIQIHTPEVIHLK